MIKYFPISNISILVVMIKTASTIIPKTWKNWENERSNRRVYRVYDKQMILMKQFVRGVLEQKVFCKFWTIPMKEFVFNKVPGF